MDWGFVWWWIQRGRIVYLLAGAVQAPDGFMAGCQRGMRIGWQLYDVTNRLKVCLRHLDNTYGTKAV